MWVGDSGSLPPTMCYAVLLGVLSGKREGKGVVRSIQVNSYCAFYVFNNG